MTGNWKSYTDAAVTDIQSAVTGHPSGALDALREALANLKRAIEALEEEEEARP